MNIVQIFPGMIWGGAEQYVLDLGLHLIEQGHNTTFVAIDNPQLRECLSNIDNVFFIKFRIFGIFNHRILFELKNILKNADVIHIHDFRFLPYVCKAKGKTSKLIVTRHIAKGNITLPWNRKYFKNIHRLIFVSDLAKTLWINKNSWYNKEKCAVIHNSIPDNAPIPSNNASLRKVYNISQSDTLLVYSGRVRKSKGCENIIYALSKLKECHFQMIFIGTPKPTNYYYKLMSIASKNGIDNKIHFYGFTKHVRSLICEADIGLAPSIVRESCHLSPMEFMQQGICVITSNNGAQSEYIKSGFNGILINPKSEEELASAIKKLILDSGYRKSLAQNAKDFFWDQMKYSLFISKITDLYNN